MALPSTLIGEVELFALIATLGWARDVDWVMKFYMSEV